MANSKPKCGRKPDFIGKMMTKKKTSAPDWRPLLENYLESSGLRQSEQRLKVAEIAMKQADHFDIQSLVQWVQKSHPEIGPATVYRTMTTLCDAGLIIETLRNTEGVPLYEPASDDHHDHIVCLDCQAIFEFHAEAIESMQQKILMQEGFKEVRHRHVIYAHCEQLK